MNRETGTKILLIGSFAASLVLPTLVYPAVRSHLDQQNYENRELASFPELSAANFDNIRITTTMFRLKICLSRRRQSWIWSF